MDKSEKQPQFDVIVVGAGQAGLVMGYFLKLVGLRFVILDENQEVGFSWKNRYDSLILFTNVRHDSLKGFKFSGDPNKFPGKDEISNYLKEYAKKFSLPIQLNTKIVQISKNESDIFIVTTERKDNYTASNVVVCSGLSRVPFIPPLAQNVNKNILQLHSSEYKNSSQLKAGSVLVVGGGNSGVQIAEELVNENRKVYFSFRGNLRSIDIRNPVLQWIDANLIPLLIRYKSFLLSLVKKIREGLVINTDIKKLFKAKNIFLVGTIQEVANDNIVCANAKLTDVQSIIWATGFKFKFDWIDFDIFNADGYPIHERGITTIPGLFFLGFFWLNWKKITFMSGISKDAYYIAQKIELRTKKLPPHSQG